MVVKKFGRPIVSVEDCSALAEAIADHTGVAVATVALEHLYLPKSRSIAPRPVTLTTLAKYVGFGSWSDFCTSNDITPAEDVDKLPVARRWGVILLTVVAVAVVVLAAVLLLNGDDDVESNNVVDNSTAVEHVDLRFASVAEEWMAGTTEHCLSLREYETTMGDNYAEHVASVNAEYRALLKDAITRDLVLYAAAQNITVDDATIGRTAEMIADICRQMCRCIENE